MSEESFRTADPALTRANIGGWEPKMISKLFEIQRNYHPASWKARPPTDKQRAYLSVNGVRPPLLAALTRGGASLLTTIIIRNKQEAWAWGFGPSRREILSGGPSGEYAQDTFDRSLSEHLGGDCDE